MKKRLRILAIVLAALFVLLLLLPFVVPADRWKDLAIEQLEKQTGWQAEAAEARLSIFPLGLRLTQIAIEDPDGDPSLERFTVAAEGVVLRADLASVLRRQPNLQEIRFQKPRIELWMRAKTGTTPTEPPSAEGAEVPPAKPAASAVGSLLAFVALEDGELILHDAKQDLTLRGVEQRAELRIADGRFELQLEGSLGSGSIEGEALPEGRFDIPALSLRVDAAGAMPAESVEIKSFHVDALEQRLAGDAEFVLDPPQLTRLQVRWTGELARLHAGMAEQLPPLPPMAEGLQLEGGEIEFDLRSNGSLDFAAPPEELLALLVGSGKLRELRASHWGETLRCSQADLELSEGTLRLREAALGLPGLTAKLELSAPLQPGEVSTSASLRGDLRALRALAARVLPQLPAELSADTPPPSEWPGAAGMVRGTLQMRIPNPPPTDPAELDAELRLQLAGVSLLLPAWRDSLHLRGGEVVANPRSADMRALQLEGPGLAGSATGQAWGWPERIESEWDVELTSIDLDKLQAAAAPPDAEKASLLEWWSRPAHAAVPAELPVPPANLGAELRLHAKELHSRGYTLREMRGRASLHEQKLQLRDAGAKLGDGDVELSADVDWTQEPPQWSGNSHAKEIPAAELLRPVAAPLADAISTRFSGDFALLGPISLKPEDVIQSLSGEMSLISAAGSLLTEPILGDALAAFLGDHYQRFQKLDFRALNAGLEVKGGAVHFDRFVVDGETELRVSGLVGLDGRCDYALDVRLPAGLNPKLGDLAPLVEFLLDDEQRFAFRVDVDGPAKKPKVAVDFAGLAERARLNAEAKAKEDLKNSLEQKGKDALGGLLDKLKKKGGGGSP